MCCGKIRSIALILAGLCLLGLAAVFAHNYYLSSYFDVHIFKDPRWRVFNLNSRQANEGEIYNVAEVPVIKEVSLVGHRKLRFEFSPKIQTNSWKVQSIEDAAVAGEGKYPEIQFPDTGKSRTYLFFPEGYTPIVPIKIHIGFSPKEGLRRRGLSWDDNYYKTVPGTRFDLVTPFSIEEWTGFPDDDPEIIKAREILSKAGVNLEASMPERRRQVFHFVMKSMKDATGCPTNGTQAASPLETYEIMSSGKGKGWCENIALVYYLFANAAGIKTRLVDRAGKFGPLKITGHYFTESWVAEQAKWVYVDPRYNIGFITSPGGVLLSALDIHRLTDLSADSGCMGIAYEAKGDSLCVKNFTQSDPYYKEGMAGDIVLAYKFGYANNKSFSKLKNFFHAPTLLYATFDLPKGYLVKTFLLFGFGISLMVFLASFIIPIFKNERCAIPDKSRQ
jgi:hypothetical protein